MGGNLWFFVVPHPHIIGIGNCGGAQPVRGAAGPRRVEVADVNRAVFHEVTTTRRRVFALPGADRDPAAHPHIAQAALIVLPANRLLKPGDVEVVYPVAELERLRDRIALVGVDGDEEVVAGGRTRFDADGVFGWSEPANLELDARQLELLVSGDLFTDRSERLS